MGENKSNRENAQKGATVPEMQPLLTDVRHGQPIPELQPLPSPQDAGEQGGGQGEGGNPAPDSSAPQGEDK